MRPPASVMLAVAVTLSIPTDGQGQTVPGADSTALAAAEWVVAEPSAALPRVWQTADPSMMQYYPPYTYPAAGGPSPAYSPQAQWSDAMASGAYYQTVASPYYDESAQAYGDYFEGSLDPCEGCYEGCESCCQDDNRYWILDAIPFRGWAKFEALYWTPRGNDVPALVTTSPQGTPQATAGRLGQATTNILFGNEGINDQWRWGGRATFGIWLTPDQLVGIEASYMKLESSTDSFETQSIFSQGPMTDPILARPFFNVNTDAQDSALLGFPNFVVGGQVVDLDGAVRVESRATIESAELIRRDVFWLDVFDGHGQSFLRLCFLTGYRYFRMDEDLTITDALFPIGGLFAPGSRIDSTDMFETDNEFHGGQIGLFAEYAKGPWAIELLAKCALGNAHEVVDIRGSTTSFDGVTSTTFAGGLLAQPTNIGRQTRDIFAVIPEANINLTCQVTCNLKLMAGYTFIYDSNVVRSGDQIDFGVNPTQFSGGVLIGQPRPGPLFKDSEYWIHGINAGLEGRW